MKNKKFISYFSRGDQAFDEGRLLGAFRLFLLGAKAGEKDCKFRLAHMYDSGHGVKTNLEKAIYWYKESDKECESFATAYNLALIYRDTEEKELELKYLCRAAELGDDYAKREIDNPEKEAKRVKREQEFRIKERTENAKKKSSKKSIT